MKKLTQKEAYLVRGSGCRRYLRRYDRAIRNDEDLVAAANLMLYMDCMYN